MSCEFQLQLKVQLTCPIQIPNANMEQTTVAVNSLWIQNTFQLLCIRITLNYFGVVELPRALMFD